MSGSKRNRRWLRFSLRSTLIVATAFCIWIGWYSVRAKHQREAVLWARSAGGGVRYDFEYDYAKNLPRNGTPAVPAWLHEFLGIDYFSTVVSFDLSDSQIDDLSPVVKFTRLERLQLWVAEVDNFAPLASLTNLKSLEVTAPKVDNLQPLSGLTKLEYLYLCDSRADDLTPLAGLTNLRVVKLVDMPVSDLSPLAKLGGLERLELRNAQATENEVARLQLALPDCKIVDK